MINPPHQDRIEELNERRKELQALQVEWLETLEEMAQTKAAMNKGDIFDMIDYLTFCDQLCTTLHVELRELEGDLQSLQKLKREFIDHPPVSNFIKNLSVDIQELRKNKYEKMQQNIDEEYSSLAENALRNSEDFIFDLSEKMQRETVTPGLKTQINQNLDRELFLQELRDSLESYREAREEFLTEVEMNTLQTQPEDRIPEDFGEEKPEMDSILSQLDTLITSCDSILLNKEIQD